jgi:nitrate reductase (cytochrome)
MSCTDRRAFLKRAAMASAAAAATSLMPGVFFGNVTGLSAREQALVWRKTPCRFCAVGCGLLVAIENGRAVAVKGDPDSPVNRGLACARGYHSVQALYGRDRLTRARVRRDGRLVEVPLQEALDLVAQRLRETVAEHGKDSVAIYGSGQWTIPDGYVASKLFKGGLGTNNVEASTRLGMGSAMAGCQTSFGLDHPLGCYEDIDHADTFVLWGSNLAETHPVLFSRLLERRQRSPAVRIIALGTRTTRTSYAADRSLLYAPHSDLAIANAICHEIVARNWVNDDFVRNHVAFKRGRTGRGYGASDGLDFDVEATDASRTDYVRFLDEYTPERAEQISGMPASDIRWLASLYGDRSRRVVSLWGSELNEHSRGTWANNLLYNIHLLVGKIATPGNGPFSLADQPSDRGTVAEVGTLTQRLPRGEVTNEEDRNLAAQVWGVPVERIDRAPGRHAVSMFRAFDDGAIRFLWVQVSNPMVSLPNLNRYRAGAGKEGRFLVVSEVYPTPTTDLADVVLPSAMWIEQEGLFGNAERRIQHFEQLLNPPGEAMSDTWQLVEVGRRLGFQDLFPWDYRSHIDEIWSEYARFRDGPANRLPPLAELRERPGIIWPYVEGRETRWRYNPAHDPAADPAYGALDFYGNPDHRAWIWLRPYEPPAEAPDAQFPFWFGVGRVLEQWGTGSMTRRIPTLHRAMPGAYVEVNRQDAIELGVQNGETVRLVSRRGSVDLVARIDHRAQPPRGVLFAPSFDEAHLVNELTSDAYCPLSGQPDYAKCAVRLERLGRGQGS